MGTWKHSKNRAELARPEARPAHSSGRVVRVRPSQAESSQIDFLIFEFAFSVVAVVQLRPYTPYQINNIVALYIEYNSFAPVEIAALRGSGATTLGRLE